MTPEAMFITASKSSSNNPCLGVHEILVAPKIRGDLYLRATPQLITGNKTSWLTILLTLKFAAF